MGEGITSNTTHSVTARYELDHLRLVEALLPEARDVIFDRLLWLWHAGIVGRIRVNAAASERDFRTTAAACQSPFWRRSGRTIAQQRREPRGPSRRPLDKDGAQEG